MSSTERWLAIREILEGSLALPEGERERFLQRSCQGDEDLLSEVRELLALDREETDWFCAPGVEEFGAIGDGKVGGESRPDRVGPYEVVRELGRGGMGLVLLARRSDGPSQGLVALKLIRPDRCGEEIEKRFERERRVLASLRHPGIARILDGGIGEDGRPYLVMEYVEGLRLDRWCDRERLTIFERLELFREVCVAVEAAHRSLVLHRDLKPGNILVDVDGRPKLVDFGIAKVLGTGLEGGTEKLTRTMRHRLTPAYASPEQMRGEPTTTASDTFSLGVILYQILTGRLPLQVEGLLPAEAERVVCEEVPTSPSSAVHSGTGGDRVSGDPVELTLEELSARRGTTPRGLTRLLGGDLDTVVAKALRKEPERRYSSALELAEDLRRYSEGLPVSARPDTLRYVVRKFVRRNRLIVATATMVVLALVGGSIFSTAQSGVENRARDSLRNRLEIDRQRVQELEALSVELRESRDLALEQRELAVERSTELERLSGRLRERTEEAEAERLRVESSAIELREVNDTLERQRSVAEERTAWVENLAVNLINSVFTALRDVPAAMEAQELVVRLGTGFLDALLADARDDRKLRLNLSRGYVRLAAVLGSSGEANLGRTADAATMSARSLGIAEQLYEESPDDEDGIINLVVALQFRGRFLAVQGRLAEATDAYQRAVDVTRVFEAEDPPAAYHLHLCAAALGALGKHQLYCDRLGQARESIDRALELFEECSEQLPRSRLDLATAHLDRAQVIHATEGPAALLPDARAAMRITEQVLSTEPDNLTAQRVRWFARLLLARGLLGTDRGEEAVEIYEDLVRLAEAERAARPSDLRALGDLAEVLSNLIHALGTLNRWEEYGRHARALLELGERRMTLDPADHRGRHARLSGLIYVAMSERIAKRYPESLERIDRAVRLGDELLDLSPEDGVLRDLVLDAFHERGQLKTFMAAERNRPRAERIRLCREALRDHERIQEEGDGWYHHGVPSAGSGAGLPTKCRCLEEVKAMLDRIEAESDRETEGDR